MEYHNKRIIAYRKGSIDAFIAAFVYWSFFGSGNGQTYVSVDPFSDRFLKKVTRNAFPEYIISIGANLSNMTGQDFIGDHEMAIGACNTDLYSFENSPTFTPGESFNSKSESGGVAHRYFYDTSKSLTKLVLETLVSEHGFDEKHRVYQVLDQGLNFNAGLENNPLIQKIGVLFPEMRPDDFRDMHAMLFEPLNFVERFSKKSLDDVKYEEWRNMLHNVRATQITSEVAGIPLVLYNTVNYAHPLFVWDTFQNEQEAPVFLYSVNEQGVRGRLLFPKTKDYAGVNAINFFPHAPGYQFCGDVYSADVLLPHAALNILLTSGHR